MLSASPSSPQSSHLSGLPGNAFLVEQNQLRPSFFRTKFNEIRKSRTMKYPPFYLFWGN